MEELYEKLELIEGANFTHYTITKVIESDTHTISKLDNTYFAVFRKVDEVDSEIIGVMNETQVKYYMKAWYANN